MNLALFDFDGTITQKDSFLDFIGYISRIHKHLIIKRILMLPVFFAYLSGLLPMGKAKELFLTFCFKGWKKSYFDEIAKKYAGALLPRLIRPIALEKIQNHKLNKDRIVVVSASLDSWLEQWCSKHELELICSSLEIKNGSITGKLKREDCNGEEKVKRIRERYHLEEYDTVFAYGNSPGDKDMLKLADIAYYRWKRL
ncbi:HAD-IB family hydrolase [Thermodesulfobacteriota bacterium]